MGVFEIEFFNVVINVVVKVVVDFFKVGSFVLVVGGGDIVVVFNGVGVVEDFIYIFIVGGVFFEWMEGKILSGVVVL